jgi:TonB family protein
MMKLANRDTTFYDKTGKIVVDKLNADSYEILSPDPVDVNKAIERIYSISGKMRSEKYFLISDLNKAKTDSIVGSVGLTTFSQKELNQLIRQTEGRYREWYDNGQLSKDFYVETGRKNGKLNFYWEDGTIRRTGTYKKGITENGECYTNNGIKIPYFEADMPSSYPGGKEAMAEYLRTNLQYPPTALQRNKQGTVNMKFVVNNIGFISRIWIPKSLDKDLDMEALRLIHKMPKWLAEFKDGDPVSSVQSLDIDFFIK